MQESETRRIELENGAVRPKGSLPMFETAAQGLKDSTSWEAGRFLWIEKPGEPARSLHKLGRASRP